MAVGTLATVTRADPAPFDLTGPTLEVTVTRGVQTLPVAQVPNLAAGDRLWIKAALPSTQSERYLLVTAFLRGATNPPPTSWFLRCETWKEKCGQDGVELTVPKDAQQVLVFLAPSTGGDFKTLVGAARGRPGAFVRTSQDLNQANLDRSRLEDYLAAVHRIAATDPTRLKEATPLLARSLAIKVDEKCLDRIPELQAPCLMQGRESLILDDGHSTSIVEALTSGPAGDLAMEASFTPQLSYGYYSPYVASVLDIARIMGSFTTAQYQYIPALASPRGDRLNLTLNTPPSFHNPKSVLVTALPAVEQAQLPPLHAVDPKDTYCARKSSLVLPVEGAPLVFSTGYAHGVTLSLSGKDGRTLKLPATADAEKGGFVVDTAALNGVDLGDSVRAKLQGYWGFEPFSGPGFELVNSHAQAWQLDAADNQPLIVGREGTVHLEASSVSCVEGIMLKDPNGRELKAEWKAVKPNEVEVKLPLQAATPGSMTLLVGQYGADEPQPVGIQTFSEAGHLDGFTIHAGDTQGVLTGTRLDEVAGLVMNRVAFLPGKLTTSPGGDQLTLESQDPQAMSAWKPGDSAKAKVTLKDGRTSSLKVAVQAARPSVTLLGKSVLPSTSSAESRVMLANADELPQDAKLTFSVHARSPAVFARDEKIEVATADQTSTATLTLGDGSITLENSRVAVATLDPAKAFGPSAFGPLLFRVTLNGVSGDWLPLATLVRLPVLRQLRCPATGELACQLSGSNLFLVDSVSGDSQFGHPVHVPDGFPGYALPVPHPTNGALYVRLRDDPSVINPATLDVQPIPPSPDELARASARQAAVPMKDSSAAPATDAAAPSASPTAGHSVTPPVLTPPVLHSSSSASSPSSVPSSAPSSVTDSSAATAAAASAAPASPTNSDGSPSHAAAAPPSGPAAPPTPRTSADRSPEAGAGGPMQPTDPTSSRNPS